MTKNGQKWPQNMVFGLFNKIKSLVCLKFVENESYYGSLASCENGMLGKILVLKLYPKMALGQ